MKVFPWKHLKLSLLVVIWMAMDGTLDYVINYKAAKTIDRDCYNGKSKILVFVFWY